MTSTPLIVEFSNEHAGCPNCSGRTVEILGSDTEGNYRGRCVRCEAEVFGRLIFRINPKPLDDAANS